MHACYSYMHACRIKGGRRIRIGKGYLKTGILHNKWGGLSNSDKNWYRKGADANGDFTTHAYILSTS